MSPSSQNRNRHFPLVFAVALASLALAGCNNDSDTSAEATPDEAGPSLPELSEQAVRPLVFVHGGAGSAAQYLSQAQRFASNGYPEELFFAFEYPGVAPHDPAALDDFVDEIIASTGEDQVYLVGHSLGTTIGLSGSGYLADPARAAKVAGYILIDGLATPDCLNQVPCLAIFDNADDDPIPGHSVFLDEQEHVESATSAESFAHQFRFLTGEKPAVTRITPQDGPVQVSGRAVIFPANTGTEGATLEVWPVDPDTGHRNADDPLTTTTIGADGWWGPVELEPDSRYEFALLRDHRQDMHFYHQTPIRNTTMLRLNASAADSEILTNTNAGPGHATLVVTRQREWIANAAQGQRDELLISTRSPQWGTEEPANVIVDGVGNQEIALHLHDDASTPAMTSLDLLPWFPEQPFQTGVDVYMPATAEPDGTITLRSHPRGNEDAAQVINVPNWASDDHRISVIFNDWW